MHEKNVNDNRQKVNFEPFVGCGPRKFIDLFSMNLSRGNKLKRKEKGQIVDWGRQNASVRVPLLPLSYLEREQLVLREINIQIQGGKDEDQKK